MDKYKKKLIETLAEEHNISSKTMNDILKSADSFSYEQTTPGKRIDEYYKMIKFAVNYSAN